MIYRPPLYWQMTTTIPPTVVKFPLVTTISDCPPMYRETKVVKRHPPQLSPRALGVKVGE